MGFLRFFWFQWGLLMKMFLKCPQNLYRNSLFSQNPETYSDIKHSVLKRVNSLCSFVQRSFLELCHTLWELRYCCKESPVVQGAGEGHVYCMPAFSAYLLQSHIRKSPLQRATFTYFIPDFV